MKDIQSNLQAKEEAATRSVEFIKNNMKVGLGTGSTTAIAIKKLGERIQKEGLKIECCVTSFQSFLLAKEYNIPVYPIQYFSNLDLTID